MSYSLSGNMTIAGTFTGTIAPIPPPMPSKPLGIILYTSPSDASWKIVATTKLTSGSFAVINPNSGPGVKPDPNYASGIKSLQSSGLKVLGYVATTYGQKPQPDAEAEVNSYKTWYGVDGIFFDEMASAGSFASYYRALDTYAKGLGMTLTVGNPGTSTSLVGIFDITNVDEGAGYPHPANLSAYPADKICFISYAVPAVDSQVLASLLPLVACFWVTDANLPNPYDSLPSYFSELAQL